MGDAECEVKFKVEGLEASALLFHPGHELKATAESRAVQFTEQQQCSRLQCNVEPR